MICNGIALQIIGMLSAELSEDHREVRSKQQIKQAVELFHTRCEDPNLTIREIASASDMSERSLRRHFDEVYHQTPYSFLQEIRIDRAKILLMSTTKSIAEIALQCGFSDVYSFSHCFKNHVGIAPSIYRDQKTPLISEERK